MNKEEASQGKAMEGQPPEVSESLHPIEKIEAKKLDEKEILSCALASNPLKKLAESLRSN